jgi:lysophospholipase L1-like esterase
MTSFFKYVSILLAILSLTAYVAPDEKIKVYLIGDSTMADKNTSAYPETGWGMPFKYFFDETVEVDNRAKNGASTKTFIAESRWQPVYENMNSRDYVLIQFGHNDEVKTKASYCTPVEFKANLTRFVTESRSKNAIPVLITPVSRRQFVDGKPQENHQEYAPLVREVAEKLKVPMIDLDVRSRELFNEFGEKNSKLLFLHLNPSEHPNYPNGNVDNTHFNELGARKIAQIVLAEIVKLRLELADRIVKSNRK